MPEKIDINKEKKLACTFHNRNLSLKNLLFIIIVKQMIITCMNNDDTKESAYIQYLGFNNQYRGALSQLILYGGLESVEDI